MRVESGTDHGRQEGALSRKRWFWLAAGCGLAFAVLTIPILMRQNWVGEWAMVQWITRARSPMWTGVMQSVTFFGSSAVGAGLCAGYSVVLLVRERRFAAQVWLPVFVMFGSAPINFGLRYACGRLRPGVKHIPHHLPELAHPFQRWSYPSGHAMTAVICYGVLAYLVVRACPALRRRALLALALWLAIIGFSRVYLGVHWPTDVLAGYLVGGSWLSLCIALLGD
jgi:undecaprenyl-diphosphatase